MLIIDPAEEGTPAAQKAELEYNVRYLFSLTTQQRYDMFFEMTELFDKRGRKKNGKKKSRNFITHI